MLDVRLLYCSHSIAPVVLLPKICVEVTIIAKCPNHNHGSGMREVVEGGMYTLVLEFKSTFEFSKWEERQAKFQVR